MNGLFFSFRVFLFLFSFRFSLSFRIRSLKRDVRVFFCALAIFFLFFKKFEYFRRFSRGGWLAPLRTLGRGQGQQATKAFSHYSRAVALCRTMCAKRNPLSANMSARGFSQTVNFLIPFYQRKWETCTSRFWVKDINLRFQVFNDEILG